MEENLNDRVRRVMEDSGLNNREFASTIGLDGAKLSKSLSGTRKFSSTDLAMIGEVGGRTVDWLLTGNAPREWRMAARTTVLDRSTIDTIGQNQIAEIAERFDALESLGAAPSVPALPARSKSSRYIEQGNALAATALKMIPNIRMRERDTASLITDVEAHLGINVAIEALPDDLDGLSYQDGNFRIVVLATTTNPFRQRYTLAHEIGHVLWGDARERLFAEKIGDRAKVDDDNQEARAGVFASAFLMPMDELSDSNADGIVADDFNQLVWDFQVSPESMAWRLKNLGYIDEEDRERFSVRTARGVAKSLNKVTDFAMLTDHAQKTRKPWSLVSAYLDAYANGGVTLRPVASLMGMSAETAEEFFGDSSGSAFPEG